MANRFTDSRKYQDPWFRRLKPNDKLIWDYIIHACDHAGIWKVDFALASFCIGQEYTYKESLNALNGKVYVVSKDKWFIPKFVEFQYGTLNPDNRVHNSVIQILKKVGAYKGLKQPLQGCKDYDKDKDKEEDILYSKLPLTNLFEEIWSKYPKRLGKKKAEIHFKASIKKQEDYDKISKALDNYLAYLKNKSVKDEYIKHGSTWFNNWQDWVEYKSTKKEVHPWPTLT